ncbi:hypothetical protein B0H16DRAFT_1719082 [Mycena metata]|uniref:F-box domain-containing protein n=1 Tax=Mycena metata TaxID=1033252 RepID=A0AAD7JG67_9AGAR|nr:hypothetical protein B0H16DRAFT_1719082 [Mycena metata]
MSEISRTLDLPPELWIYIHRLVTSELSPLANLDSVEKDFAMVAIPVTDEEFSRFLKVVCSLGRVYKLWNELTQEILYENVWVKGAEKWPSLSAALERPLARRVRSVRLSTTRFDHNALALRRCPQVEVVFQPYGPEQSWHVFSTEELELPQLFSLKRLYYVGVESLTSRTVLQNILGAAPNLEHVSLSSVSIFNDSIPGPQIAVTAFPHLTSLFDCPTLDPMEHPLLPALQTLSLVGDDLRMPSPPNFLDVLRCCPNLCELRYQVYSRPIAPATLKCVRLHLHDRRGRWPTKPAPYGALEQLLGPAFSSLECIMLDGPGWAMLDYTTWDPTIAHRARGRRLARGFE